MNNKKDPEKDDNVQLYIIRNIPNKTHLQDTQNETEASLREIASLTFHLL